MERSFAMSNTEDVRKDIMSMLKPGMETSYDSLIGIRKKNKSQFHPRQPSDISLREQLKSLSHPKESKIQVAHGFDFYLDKDKLKEMEERFKEPTVVEFRRCGRFGVSLLAQLVEGQRCILATTAALTGDDLFEAVYCTLINS